MVSQSDGCIACPTCKQKILRVFYFIFKKKQAIELQSAVKLSPRSESMGPIPPAGGNGSIALRFGFAFRRHNLRVTEFHLLR